jgi:chromosome segregation ATPase
MINEWQHLADEIDRLSSDLKDKTVKLGVANDVIEKLKAERDVSMLVAEWKAENAGLRVAWEQAVAERDAAKTEIAAKDAEIERLRQAYRDEAQLRITAEQNHRVAEIDCVRFKALLFGRTG